MLEARNQKCGKRTGEPEITRMTQMAWPGGRMVTKKMSDVRGKMQHGKLPTANWRLHAGGVAALVCIGLMALAGLVQAQPAPGSQVPGSKYYVWGQVRTPGAYSFIASPDILELLSAAGGPTPDANLKRVVLIRAVSQTRTRIGGNNASA